MIALTECIPELSSPEVCNLKIKCLYDSFGNDGSVCFWRHKDVFLSLSSGNLVIGEGKINETELTEFISMLSPESIFLPETTAKSLKLKPTQTVNTMKKISDEIGETVGDTLSSNELYEILRCADFPLPPYPEFAVDWCRRLNRGNAQYYGLKEKCAAIAFTSGNYVLINGIASHEKGLGGKALSAILQKNLNKTVMACCSDSVVGFYEKYGFKDTKQRIAIINEYR